MINEQNNRTRSTRMQQINADKSEYLLRFLLVFSLALRKSSILTYVASAKLVVNRYSAINPSSYSVILGGYSNEILNADFSLAFGNDVSIDEDYVTVFYNSTYPGKIGVNQPNPTSTVDIYGEEEYNQLRLERDWVTSPPTSSADSRGHKGDIAWDADYIYIKVSDAGDIRWKRAQLESF